MSADSLAILNTICAAVSALAALASTVGITFAARQLRLAKDQSVTAFEDGLAREYRELVNRLPTKALLGETLQEEEHQKSFDEFYRYFDLSNEQIFLFKKGRISEVTWTSWREGILSNIRRPAFSRAWAEISARSNGDFSELRRLLASG